MGLYLQQLISDLITIFPELILLFAVILCFLFACFKNSYNKIFYCSAFGLFIPFLIYCFSYKNLQIASFSSSLLMNNFNLFFIILVLLSSLIALFVSKRQISFAQEYKEEFCIFLMSATLGAVFLIKSIDLISIFISLELLSISTYFLISYGYNIKNSINATLKYFIFSTATSAFLVYGFSLLYGITAKTNLSEIYQYIIENNSIYSPVTFAAIIMIFAAVAFKTSLVPFHMWTSDVYKGTAPAVNIFLSCSSKFAVFCLLMKIISINAFANIFIYFIAILTVTIGSILAIRESNIKKLMAYSTVAQAGFILSGICILNNGTNLLPVFFYMFVYMFMNIAAWICIELLTQKEKEMLNDINGLFYINPLIGLCFSVSLIGLAGLPVSAGFFSKFYLLKSVFFSGEFFIPLFIILILNTVLGIFYYMKITKYIFSKPINRNLLKIDFNFSIIKILLIFCTAITLLGGFYPDILKNYVNEFSNISVSNQT